MKQFLFVLVFTISAFATLHAQTPYTSVKDNQQVTILNGIISKYILQNDPVFNWYVSSQSSYTPAVELINTLEAAKGKVSFVIFLRWYSLLMISIS